MLTKPTTFSRRLYLFYLLLNLLFALTACAKKPAEEDYQPHMEKSKAAMAAGDYDTAVKESSTAIAAKPEAEAYRVRGEAQAAKGDHDQAANDFYEALDRDQNSPEVWCALGMSDTARKEYGSAEAAFGKAIRLDANYAPAYYGRALLNKALDKREEAIADCKRVIEKSNDEKLKASAQTLWKELDARP